MTYSSKRDYELERVTVQREDANVDRRRRSPMHHRIAERDAVIGEEAALRSSQLKSVIEFVVALTEALGCVDTGATKILDHLVAVDAVRG